ncbi:MAG: hypothetical protein IPM17_04010 [Verrucomicrobia bacterium]|nr:hypothetical protein [Verrucomicrobiota bacterium]
MLPKRNDCPALYFVPTVCPVTLAFVTRDAGLRELDAAAAKGGLLAEYGRRCVGKTRLLVAGLGRRDGWYSQAIEGPVDLPVQQVFGDLRGRLDTTVVPKSWAELFDLLRPQRQQTQKPTPFARQPATAPGAHVPQTGKRASNWTGSSKRVR